MARTRSTCCGFRLTWPFEVSSLSTFWDSGPPRHVPSRPTTRGGAGAAPPRRPLAPSWSSRRRTASRTGRRYRRGRSCLSSEGDSCAPRAPGPDQRSSRRGHDVRLSCFGDGPRTTNIFGHPPIPRNVTHPVVPMSGPDPHATTRLAHAALECVAHTELCALIRDGRALRQGVTGLRVPIECGAKRDMAVPALQRGCGTRRWGRDGLGAGARGRGREGAEGVDVGFAPRRWETGGPVLACTVAARSPLVLHLGWR